MQSLGLHGLDRLAVGDGEAEAPGELDRSRPALPRRQEAEQHGDAKNDGAEDVTLAHCQNSRTILANSWGRSSGKKSFAPSSSITLRTPGMAPRSQ